MSEGQTPPGEPLDYQTPTSGYQGPPPTDDAKTMALLCHLLGIFTQFIGPLIIWLWKRDTSPFVDDQGKEALNFQITVAIGLMVGVVTAWFCIGVFIMLGVFILNLVFCIIATLKAREGVAYRYPFTLRLIK